MEIELQVLKNCQRQRELRSFKRTYLCVANDEIPTSFMFFPALTWQTNGFLHSENERALRPCLTCLCWPALA